MKRVVVLLAVVIAVLATSVTAFAAGDPQRVGAPIGGTVYVTSQELYYDVVVPVDELPMKGRFQKLVNGTTEFGPGDPGYLGGRWWVDANGNDEMDEGDTYFLCPLLGPGRATP